MNSMDRISVKNSLKGFKKKVQKKYEKFINDSATKSKYINMRK